MGVQGRHHVVVIGASAGGVRALRDVIAGLPGDFAAPLLIVLHVNPDAPSLLPAILGRATKLETRHAIDGDEIVPGRILVAPPDYQTTVADGALRVERGPRENNMRPAIDPLMRTAARHLGTRVVGVVLTGMLHDGTVGLAAVKAAGGVTIVQDPDTAEYSSMPRHALEAVGPDHVVSVDELPSLLERLVSIPVAGAVVAGNVEHEPERLPLEIGDEHKGRLTAFTCPECHGTLWELDGAGVPTFHCRVGHRYAVHSLLAAQAQSTEATLWAACRALEEKASLNRRVAARLAASGHDASALKFERLGEEAEVQAAQLKLLIEQVETPPAPVPVTAA